MTPTLKMNTKTVFEVEYSDLEKFVNDTYGIKPAEQYSRGYDFVANEEANNDSVYNFSVTPRPFDKWFNKEKFLSTGYAQFRNNDILNDLCHRGLIPEGDYLISVYW